MFKVYLILVILLESAFSLCAKVSIRDMYEAYGHLPLEELDRHGLSCLKENRIDSALAFYTILANRIPSNPSSADIAYGVKAYNAIGIMNFLQGNYSVAYSNFLNSIEIYDVPDAPGYQNISAIYHYYGDTVKANACLRQVIEYALQKGHWEHAATALTNMASTNVNMNNDMDMSLNLSHLRTLADNMDSSFVRRHPYISSFCLAMRESAEGRHGNAVRKLKETVSVAENMLIPMRDVYASYNCIAKEFLSMGMPDSAISYVVEAERLARRCGFQELAVEAYRNLSCLYGKTGLADKEREYYIRHLELSDSILKFKDFGRIRDLELAHEVSYFQNEISKMTFEKRLRSRTLFWVCVTMVIFFILMLLLLWQNRRLKDKNRELFARNLAEMRGGENVTDVYRSGEHKADSSDADTPVNDVYGDKEDEVAEQKYIGSRLSDDEKVRIMEKINVVMADSSYYCREDFSLKMLANECLSNVSYVSQVINECMGKSFSLLVSEARVGEARRRFIDFERYGHLTIEAIVSELGFKSRSTFSKTFKKITGLTPSEFQKMAKDSRPAD